MMRASAPPFVAIGLIASACYSPAVIDDSGPDSTGGPESSSSTTATTTATTTVDTTADTSTAGPTTTIDPDSSSTAPGSSEAGSSSTGEPGAPEIEVAVDGTATASGDALAFATVDVGAVVELTVEITNTGTADLTVDAVTVLGDAVHFAIADLGAPVVLTPGASADFGVTFAPTNGGLKDISIDIASDDADEDPYTLHFSGHTTANTYRQLAPAASPSGRFNATLEDLGDGRLLLFGGRDAGGVWLNDTWIFDVDAETWTQLAPATPPSARNAHDMAYDGVGTVVLFGGSTAMGGGALGDTWVFDVATEEWSNVGGIGPTARLQHAMAPLGNGDILLYGGRTGGGSTEVADTWMFDVDTLSWSQPGPAGAPPATSAFAFSFDGTDAITLFGGFAANVPLDQTWSYTISTNTWAQVMPTSTPGARGVLQGEYLADGRMVVFSGKLDGCCIDPTGGTFAFDPIAGDWSNITPPGEPSPRFNYGMAAVAGQNKTIVFGGLLTNVGIATALAETWEYVGTAP